MSDNPVPHAVSDAASAEPDQSSSVLPPEILAEEHSLPLFEPPIEPRGLQPLNLKEERESQTARTLSLTLVWVLVGVFLVHYALLTVLGIYHPEVVGSLEHVFNTAFPVFSGLVGTAVGFYLKERK